MPFRIKIENDCMAGRSRIRPQVLNLFNSEEAPCLTCRRSAPDKHQNMEVSGLLPRGSLYGTPYSFLGRDKELAQEIHVQVNWL